MAFHLEGLSAFPITPADAAGCVDVEAMKAVVRRLVEAEVDSIGLLGSTGTYAYLTRDERRRATETALDEVGGRMPVMVGVGALRTDDAVRLARDAKAAGATAGLLAPVSYTPLNDHEVFEHFSTVAQEGGLPLCIYDNPGTTHFTFSPDLIGRLSRVDGIIAVKTGARATPEMSGQLSALREAVRPDFSVGFSVDLNAPEGLLAGADAWYSVIGGTLPRASMAIARAARRGDAAEARRIHGAMEPVWACFRDYTSLRVVYVLAAVQGLDVGDPPRPILPLDGAARAEIADAFAALPPELRG